jgi:hypothetical protein
MAPPPAFEPERLSDKDFEVETATTQNSHARRVPCPGGAVLSRSPLVGGKPFSHPSPGPLARSVDGPILASRMKGLAAPKSSPGLYAHASSCGLRLAASSLTRSWFQEKSHEKQSPGWRVTRP